jgi:heme/copper-type cytochrome/quinol oxidase subunit 2
MDFITIITMIVVLGIVWGGMVIFLTRAMKYEKLKEKNEQNL